MIKDVPSSSKSFEDWDDDDLQDTLDRCQEELTIAQSSYDFIDAEISRRRLKKYSKK